MDLNRKGVITITTELIADHILSAKEVGEALSLPHKEVIRRIRRGDIQAQKWNWNWVIEATELERVKDSEWYKRYLNKQRN